MEKTRIDTFSLGYTSEIETPIDGLRNRYEPRNRNHFTFFFSVTSVSSVAKNSVANETRITSNERQKND
jgi:hypothetical protein